MKDYKKVLEELKSWKSGRYLVDVERTARNICDVENIGELFGLKASFDTYTGNVNVSYFDYYLVFCLDETQDDMFGYSICDDASGNCLEFSEDFKNLENDLSTYLKKSDVTKTMAFIDYLNKTNVLN